MHLLYTGKVQYNVPNFIFHSIHWIYAIIDKPIKPISLITIDS